MKVATVLICLTCDEIVEVTTAACPSCADTHFLLLSRIIKPLVEKSEER